jgi:hypothetical protein
MICFTICLGSEDPVKFSYSKQFISQNTGCSSEMRTPHSAVDMPSSGAQQGSLCTSGLKSFRFYVKQMLCSSHMR